jgi:hypothetical protein
MDHVDFARNWSVIWQELCDNLTQQPRCLEHPSYPCFRTLAQGVINDIIKIDEHGLWVRSHRTLHEDYIEEKRLETWWTHLAAHKTASLSPGDPNNPHPWRSRLVGAILATGLPHRIRRLDTGTLALLS